jgi:hypothetical protein
MAKCYSFVTSVTRKWDAERDMKAEVTLQKLLEM